MEDESQRTTEGLDEVRSHMVVLTSAVEKNDKKLDDLMETMDFLKRNWKGKEHEQGEAGSSTRTGKHVPPKNTGYHPGFIPATPPTNLGYQKGIGDNHLPVDLQYQPHNMGFNDFSQVKTSMHPNPNLHFASSAQFIPPQAPLPPLLQQYLASLNLYSDSTISHTLPQQTFTNPPMYHPPVYPPPPNSTLGLYHHSTTTPQPYYTHQVYHPPVYPPPPNSTLGLYHHSTTTPQPYYTHQTTMGSVVVTDDCDFLEDLLDGDANVMVNRKRVLHFVYRRRKR
ncbi:hypothetical protein POM88_034328 [Heracleum sosnowskyi]|uniref:Uncharacterized protein n=1 Tax=Heracleum sosnowskyi TaxID=360622 RepID=A0AAD8MC47_9APIA|nr:hypothetical protein POM88_034328 [Heracleum sosnowskyi]